MTLIFLLIGRQVVEGRSLIHDVPEPIVGDVILPDNISRGMPFWATLLYY